MNSCKLHFTRQAQNIGIAEPHLFLKEKEIPIFKKEVNGPSFRVASGSGRELRKAEMVLDCYPITVVFPNP